MDVVADKSDVKYSLKPMARAITLLERVAEDIGVSIETLRILRLGDQCIGLSEPPQRRVVVSRVVEIQPARHVVQHLPGEAALRRRRTEGNATTLAPRLVANLRQPAAGLADCQRRAAEMIGRQPAHHPVDPQRDALTAGLVVLRDRRAAANHRLHPVAVRVMGVARGAVPPCFTCCSRFSAS